MVDIVANQATQSGFTSRLLVIAEVLFLLVALASLVYAVVTAQLEGKDLAAFQDMGRAWVAGIYQAGEGTFYGPPPFASVLFSPLAVLSFEQWRVIFIGLNLIAAGLVLFFVKQLWGATWPAKAHLYLAYLVSIAPFRVTVRYGQISLIVTALLLGAFVARRRNSKVLAGVLVGLSLSKYPLTLPFFLYFALRKEWKIVAAAILIVGVLTEIFALRLGLSLVAATGNYVEAILHISALNDPHFAGRTEIGPFLFQLTAGNEVLAGAINFALIVAAMLSMVVVFRRRPQCERLHLAVIAFFSLWYVYHRTYDSVLCTLPAAVFVDFLARRIFPKLAVISLAVLSLLVISVPGLLEDRLHLAVEDLLAHPAGVLALNLERLLVFGMFCCLLVFLWRTVPGNCGEAKDSPSS
jgi:Glycosyltransferase family 87